MALPANIPHSPASPTGGTTFYRSTLGISDSAALLELSTILNSSLDLDFILSNVLLSAMGKLMIARGVVLVEHRKWTYSVRSLKGIRDMDVNESFVLPVDWKGILEVDAIVRSSDKGVRNFAHCCLACGIHLLVPMKLNNRMVGIVGLGKKITDASFTDEELTFLESIAAVAATAVSGAVTIDALRESNRQLDTRVQELNTLFELSREMNATLDEQAILRVLSYALMGQIRCMRFIVFRFDGKTLDPVLVKIPGFKPKKRHQKHLLDLEAMTVFSGKRPPKGAMEQWLHDLGIHVLIPMRTQQQTRGVLCLGARMGTDGYHETELDLLSALSNITIAALENARLFKETIEKEQWAKELSLARNIQKGLLPITFPALDEFEIAANNESSQQVGGDYYDVITLSEHEYILAIGDVSGKGIPASLLMANVQAALRAIAPLRLPLPEATQRINDIVFRNTGADKFITFFWGVLDTDNATFEYVNAGHNPPYLLHGDGTIDLLSEGGMILGVFPDPPPYLSATVTLKPGDTILTYTDGVNEALSRHMEEFGDERLQKLCRKLKDESAEILVDRIRREILNFTRGAKQSDDITLLTVKRRTSSNLPSESQ